MKSAKALTLTYLTPVSFASLNGSDKEADNISSIKKISVGAEQFPYVSSQAIRRALRNQLGVLGRELSEGIAATISKGAATTQQKPYEYIDDDLFGYMGTEEGKGAIKRTSVVRVSPLIALNPYQGDLDFGTNYMSEKANGKPNIFETEIHSGLYRGTILIELDRVGTGDGFDKPKSYLFTWDDIPGNDNDKLKEFIKQEFSIGWVIIAKIEKIDDGKTIRVYFENNSLSLRLNDEKTKINLRIADGRTDEFIVKHEKGKLTIYDRSLGKKEKASRVKDLLVGIKNLWTSGRQSRFLADVSPKFVAGAILKTKNPIFLESIQVEGKEINDEMIKETLKDFNSEIISSVIGLRNGFFISNIDGSKSVGEAFDEMAKWIDKHYE